MALAFDLDTMADMELDGELFAFVFHHIFLPPKLPQGAEPNLPKLEPHLVNVVRHILGKFYPCYTTRLLARVRSCTERSE